MNPTTSVFITDKERGYIYRGRDNLKMITLNYKS